MPCAPRARIQHWRPGGVRQIRAHSVNRRQPVRPEFLFGTIRSACRVERRRRRIGHRRRVGCRPDSCAVCSGAASRASSCREPRRHFFYPQLPVLCQRDRVRENTMRASATVLVAVSGASSRNFVPRSGRDLEAISAQSRDRVLFSFVTGFAYFRKFLTCFASFCILWPSFCILWQVFCILSNGLCIL